MVETLTTESRVFHEYRWSEAAREDTVIEASVHVPAIQCLVSQFFDLSYGRKDHISLQWDIVLASLVFHPHFPQELARRSRSDSSNTANMDEILGLVVYIAF